jgi:hypothetical protein
MNPKHKTEIGWRQVAAAGLLMPLLAFCAGPGAAPAAATTIAVGATDTAGADAAGANTIYINEILAHTDEPQIDTVELYNAGATPVDLTGWCLSDDQDEPKQFCVAQQEPRVLLPAGGFQVYTANDFPFRLSEFGETLYLYAPGPGGLQQTDAVKFGVSPNGVSLGRYVTSSGSVDFPLQRTLTLGAANAGPLIPAAVISELMYQPAQEPEYLVITNRSNQPFPLYDPDNPSKSWQVMGIGNNNGAYVLPAQLMLQAGESIVLSADPAAFLAAHPDSSRRVFGPYAGKLDNDGERIALQAPQPPETNGDVAYADMDVVKYGVAAPWPAAGAANQPLVRIDLGGYGNEPGNWRAGAGAELNRVLMLPLVTR